MTLAERIEAFVSLGNYLHKISPDEADRLYRMAQSRNGWFTPANVRFALNTWAGLLREESLKEWLKDYSIPDEQDSAKRVGVVMAGNVPLMGFHDMLCVLISGHQLFAKASSSDPLPQLLAQKLIELEPRFSSSVVFQDMLKNMNAYIATGGEDISGYYEYYFRNKATLIRKNRTSCAVLTGTESEAELKSLGRDMLQYWGLGARSVNKLFVPRNYHFPPLFEALESWADVQNHHKWTNNYDYQKSILLVNGIPHLDTGFLLFRESDALHSPLSVIFYQYYDDTKALAQFLEEHKSKLQCVIGQENTAATIPFGRAQRPQLWEYADGTDTLEFLLNLQ